VGGTSGYSPIINFAQRHERLALFPLVGSLFRNRADRRAGVVSLMVVSVLLGACSPGPVSGERDAARARPSPISPLGDQGAQLTRPSKVTRELLGGRISLPWSILEVRGNSLLVRVEYGGCAEFDQFKTHETSSRVTIAALAVAPVASADVCRPDRQRADHEVRLEAPLGSRVLVHVPVTRHWADPGTKP
jgi:hypothetical protein